MNKFSPPNTNTPRQPPRSLRHQQGWFTVEAIIGIVVFMGGTLGLMALQSNTTRAVSDAQFRSGAAF